MTDDRSPRGEEGRSSDRDKSSGEERRSRDREANTMAKVITDLTHCIWRDGRPRFVPGPALRAMGYEGRDLKHEDGRWYSLNEAKDFSRSIIAEVGDRRARKAAGQRPARPVAPMAYTVAQMVEDVLQARRPDEDARKGKTPVSGAPKPDKRQRRKKLKPKTYHWYRKMAKVLKEFAPDIWTAPAAAVSRPTAYGLYEKLDDARGLATARGVIATLSMAYSWTSKRRSTITTNPCQHLGLETPAPRVRLQEPHEMERLVAAADALGRHEIGDAIMLGLFTGQRQNDRLALTGGSDVDGRLLFRQLKTGAVVLIPKAAALTRRLNAARIRRHKLKVDWPHILIDEQVKRPWREGGDHYRHVFAEIREAAIKGVKDKDGAWIIKPCAALKGLRDQDLRDIAVTWLALAGCTLLEIVAITGHSIEHAGNILRHYLGRHPELADHAIGKLVAWLDEKDATL